MKGVVPEKQNCKDEVVKYLEQTLEFTNTQFLKNPVVIWRTRNFIVQDI